MPIETIPMMKQDEGNIGTISKVQNNLLKVPIAKEGTWHHPRYGSVKFSLEDLDIIKRNFEKNILTHTPYITFGHIDEEPFSTDSHRKRGDLKELFIDDATLFGIFEAKPEAYDSVKNGDYEFSSCEVVRGFMDKESGEEVGSVLLRVALTNSPYLPFSTEEKVMALSENINDKARTILSINMKTEVDKESFNEEVKETESTPTSQNIDINKQEAATKEEGLKEDKESSTTQGNSTSVEDPTKKDEEDKKGSLEEKEVQSEESKEDKSIIQPKVDVKDNTSDSSQVDSVKDVDMKDKETLQEISDSKESSQEEDKKDESKVEDVSNKEEQPDIKSDINPDNEAMNQVNNSEAATIEKNSQAVETPVAPAQPKPIVPDPARLSNLYRDDTGNLDVKGIVDSMEAKMQRVYEQRLSTQETTISALSRQLEEIKQEKLSQEKALQEQKLSALQAQEKIAREQDRILADYLVGSGVTPALVQRFTLLRESLLKGEYTINLSQGNGEPSQEVTVTQALADLIVDAVNTNTVEFSQQGVSYRRNDPQGVFTSIEETIRKNREMAQSRINGMRA